MYAHLAVNLYCCLNFKGKLVFLGAVKARINTATEKEIEDAIKVWLKHAQDRMKKLRENA